MFLKSLSIYSAGKEVRTVPFRKGLNLILDDTTTERLDSGNNVGKTTLLRLVDFCLGGDGHDIYRDPETKSENEKIKSFLYDESTHFVLKLYNRYADYEITRGFISPPLIDNEEVTEEELKSFIAKKIFGLEEVKPSSRQLINKFIRTRSYQVDNILKFMHSSTSDDVYELVHLYLFGFVDQNLIRRKLDKQKEIKLYAKKRTAIKSISPNSVKQIVITIDKEIKLLEDAKLAYKFAKEVNEEVDKLSNLRKLSGDSRLALAQLKLKLGMANKTIAQLEGAKSKIDVTSIKEIYEKAKAFIPDLHKTFEDVLTFHNSMIENKLKFVQENIVELHKKIDKEESQLNLYLNDEEKTVKSMGEKGALDDYDKLNAKIIDFKEKRIQNTALLDKLKFLDDKIVELKDELKEINGNVEKQQKHLDAGIEKFNEFYSMISKRLYGEEFVLYYDNNDGIYRFNVTSVQGAVGSGKKKGEITSFDLAYLKFLESKQALTCRFQLNDRMEEVSANQLETAFKIAEEIDGQYIVPILKDKVKGIDQELLKSATILTLSQSDKLFKLP